MSKDLGSSFTLSYIVMTVILTKKRVADLEFRGTRTSYTRGAQNTPPPLFLSMLTELLNRYLRGSKKGDKEERGSGAPPLPKAGPKCDF